MDIAFTIFINGHFTDTLLDHTTTARTQVLYVNVVSTHEWNKILKTLSMSIVIVVRSCNMLLLRSATLQMHGVKIDLALTDFAANSNVQVLHPSLLVDARY